MLRVHLIINGDVIGVGYRTWVVRQAKALVLTGWVKNREDRTVEIVAEGDTQALEKLIAVCKKGPDIAWVEHVDVDWPTATGEFPGFTVLY